MVAQAEQAEMQQVKEHKHVFKKRRQGQQQRGRGGQGAAGETEERQRGGQASSKGPMLSFIDNEEEES